MKASVHVLAEPLNYTFKLDLYSAQTLHQTLTMCVFPFLSIFLQPIISFSLQEKKVEYSTQFPLFSLIFIFLYFHFCIHRLLLLPLIYVLKLLLILSIYFFKYVKESYFMIRRLLQTSLCVDILFEIIIIMKNLIKIMIEIILLQRLPLRPGNTSKFS